MDDSLHSGGLRDLVDINLVGDSREFRAAIARALHIAQFDVPVTIYGETGSGKEVLAEAIHYSSPRANGPFIPVNCGALTDTLLESELFGHEKGSFTHAFQQHHGLVEQAEKGSLFLDEIEALSPRGQVTLLRFLQDFQYRRVGGKTLRRADIRVITATNVPLATLRDEGRLREDLFYRLNVMPLTIPPLRHRDEDVLLLARHFLSRHKTRLGLRSRSVQFSHRACIWLTQQSWPGNVRELENVVLRGLLSAPDTVIEPEHFQSEIPAPTTDAFQCNTDTGLPFNDAKQRAIDAFEQDYLARMLRKSEGNVSRAARWAGKERRAFGKLLKKHAIDPRRFC